MRCSSKTEDLNEALRLLQLIGLMYNVNRKGNYYQKNHMIILVSCRTRHLSFGLSAAKSIKKKKKNLNEHQIKENPAPV